MSEETRMLKEILNNADLDNYAIDDDECYLSGYARKCLKKVLDQLQQKDNIIKDIKAQLEYLETYSSKEDVFKDMKRRLNNIEKIIGENNDK